MNLRVVSSMLGTLTFATGCAMFFPLLLAMYYREADGVGTFLVGWLICLCISFELKRYGKFNQDRLSVREGVAITGLGWILVSALGTFPYLFGGYLGLLDSAVESVAGFSGVGATVIGDMESLPRSVLLWRSLSNWVGGLGIIVIFMAILPQLGRGAMYLFRAESTGPTSERQLPRIRDNAKALFIIYVVLSALCTVVYCLCGLDWFAAVNHALTTIATGGFSTYNTGVLAVDNYWLEAWMTFFMVVSGGSFALYVTAWRSGREKIWQSDEFRAYLFIMLAAALMILADLLVETDLDILSAFRYAFFHVASITSTTGFVLHDFDTWPGFSKGLLIVLMFLGGCAGSTSGGLKISRVILLVKMVRSVLWQKLYPLRMHEVYMNGRQVHPEILLGVARFFFAYMLVDIGFALWLMLGGLSMVDGVSVSIATMGSVGQGFGIAGAMSSYELLPTFGKIGAIFVMFLGRLEIFTVLALFLPEFWSKKRGW
ncbi:MAG: TrkH family potassium uptake protein [Selenomonadaceae bacterium]|nr:TrkH family potassium uptake protein [Selenomonadaceae bacterium]